MTTLTPGNYASRWKFTMSLLEIKGTFCHCAFDIEKKYAPILIFENVKNLLLSILVLKIHSKNFRLEVHELRNKNVGVAFRL